MQIWPCVKDSCVDPVSRPNMESDYVTGVPVQFEQNVTYSCALGTFFENDKDQADFGVTCNDTGDFLYPVEWPQCVESKNGAKS